MLTRTMAGTLGALTLAGGWIFHQGVVRVSVEETKPGGERVRLVLPAALLPLGVRAVPEEAIREAAPAARDVLPAIRLAARELARCPDTLLVEVRDAGEHIRLAKRDGRLILDVDSPRERVHVSLPLRTLAAIADRVEAASRQGS